MASTDTWNTKRFDGSDYSKFRLRFMLFVQKKEWNNALDEPKPAEATKGAAWEKHDVKIRSTLVDAVTD